MTTAKHNRRRRARRRARAAAQERRRVADHAAWLKGDRTGVRVRRSWSFRVRGGWTVNFDMTKGTVAADDRVLFQGAVVEMAWDGDGPITREDVAEHVLNDELEKALGGPKEPGEA